MAGANTTTLAPVKQWAVQYECVLTGGAHVFTDGECLCGARVVNAQDAPELAVGGMSDMSDNVVTFQALTDMVQRLEGHQKASVPLGQWARPSAGALAQTCSRDTTNLVCIGAPWGEAVWRQIKHLPGTWRRLAQTVEGVDLADEVGRLAPDRLWFLNWSERVPDAVLVRECINFHCTRLPFGRGGHPLENLVLRGETETVITAHRMVPELDSGPVYATSEPVSLAGSKDEILARFVEPVVALIRLIVTEQPEPQPQQGAVVKFKRLKPEQYAEVWRKRAEGLL